jgi:site-specific DNA recombinase
VPVRAALYLRISLDVAGEQLGVDRQRDACTLLARQRGWDVVDEYVDNSVSATKARPKDSDYRRLVSDVQAGRLDAVIAWDIDRLTRTPREIEDWIDWSQRVPVRLVTTDGEVDTATENGRLFLRIKVSVARHEVEMKAKRQRALHEQRRSKGLPPRGNRALGWAKDGVTIIDAEAAAIRKACDVIMAGGSLRSIARDWNAAGLRTTFNGDWKITGVREVLMNPRLAALVATRPEKHARWEVVGQGTWPAILTEETWRAVVEILDNPDRLTRIGDTRRRHLLSGFATCGVCGLGIKAGALRGRPVYKCTGPVQHLSRVIQPIDEYVTTQVLLRLALPEAAAAIMTRPAPSSADVAELRSDLQAKRAWLDNLGELVADGTLSTTQVRAAKNRLAREITDLEAQVTSLGRHDALAALVASGDVISAWEALDNDVSARRAILQRACRVTLLSPGRGRRTFDPASVRIEMLA